MHKRHSLSAGEIGMYFYLLEASNCDDWVNPVVEQNSVLQDAIGVKSFNTLCQIRNRLKQAGLIRFKTKNGVGKTEYDLFDADTLTFSTIEKVTDEVDDEVYEKGNRKVTAEVIENTIVLYKHKPKPKPLIKPEVGPVKTFNLRGHLVKRNAGEYLFEKFEARLEQEFMKDFKGLDLQEMLAKFTEKSFMMSFSDENHLFNSFKKQCKDALSEKNKPTGKNNLNETLKSWGG